MHLPILYQDSDYVVIDKPSGLFVHRSPLDPHETVFALQLLRDQIGREVFPCHRLDRPTSGILLFALHRDALRDAQSEFAARRVRKTYQALVRGWTNPEGRIDYPLRSETQPSKLQEAVTDYQTLARSRLTAPLGRYPEARFSLIELHPLTGRTHQLRRHLAHLRHPILGDTRHGDGTQNKFLQAHCGERRLMLRATRLNLSPHGRSKPLQIEAPPEADFQRIASRLGFSR
jgi:tRNA pseudouridine65 synthase